MKEQKKKENRKIKYLVTNFLFFRFRREDRLLIFKTKKADFIENIFGGLQQIKK
jgi:hypothetical protein